MMQGRSSYPRPVQCPKILLLEKEKLGLEAIEC